jgi:thiol-disulfide isomerase/thioredoxin
MSKWLAGMLVLFLWSCGAVAEESPAKELPAREFPSSETVFATTFTDLDGKPVALADFRGKPLVLNFWATWCPPCLKEIPDLVEIHSRYAARGVVLVGVAVEEAARVPEFVKAISIT